MTATVHKTCNLCEAMCGLVIETREGHVERIRADPDDPLSRGAICPKAIGLREIQEDPDRLRSPVRKTADGWKPVAWDDALREAAASIAAIQQEHGNDAFGSYLGNPSAHNFGTIVYLTALSGALATRNKYAASSLDQNPKHASSLLLYGNFLSIPVPDIDHTDFFLVLGANPVISNGSLMTAPGFRARIRALHARGGKLVVVDPRRSETAALADQHLFIAPGRDAFLLAALAHTIFEEKLGRRSHLERFIDGTDPFCAALAPFSPERVENSLGIDAATVRTLAREFAGAPSAACYGRVGTCQTPFGTLNSWLIDVLNLLCGNLDRPGGILFPAPAVDLAELAELRGATGTMGKWRTRVRGAVAFNGEQPTACLAEEILEPGEGQIRGMVTIAGNPCLSAPNARALDRAFASLDYYVAIDFYINETTRHADLILPPTWSLEHDNHEALFHGFAVHNTAKYSPVVIPPGPEQRDEWQILSGLGLRIRAAKSKSRVKRAALAVARRLVPGPRRALDWMLRLGPHGDRFRPWRRGLRLRDLEKSPSGIDLGPLCPRLAEMLERHNRRIDLAPAAMLAELIRLRHDGVSPPLGSDTLVLIGRRDMRTNNSWFHNIRLATKGPDRCTVQVHPEDAAARNLADGDRVVLTSRVGSVTTTLEVSEDLMPGVISLPHGWGHTGDGLRMSVATAHAGVNCNDLVDDRVLDPVVGNAVFNGVPVELTRAAG